jgi:hypothetical protein
VGRKDEPMTLDFTVLGDAAPQGSMRAIMPRGASRPIMTSDNSHTQPWRQQVGMVALMEKNRQGFELVKRPGAVSVRLAFFFRATAKTSDAQNHEARR